MMEMKKSTSPDDPGATASVLRRLTRTPTGQRLGLRRTSTATSSFTTSSVSSLSSLGCEQTTLSCASRNTSSDDCALSNFIVWVAVKRNACQKMTPEERRECPLLHCRKTFPNHELMLNHLYDCPHLPGGEYWCYDCGRSEKLGDSKCRRCLGHASKRRRLVSMAKKIFGSLGNRAKGNNNAFATAPVPTMSASIQDEPPSYDSVCPFELPLNEIHEIDSNEVSLPMIQGCEPERAAEMLFMLQPDFALGHGLEPATGRQEASGLDGGFINWGAPSPLPPTVAPQNLMRSAPVPGRASDRPALQLHTHGLDQYRPPQARRRSKTLAPSSSVRSTSSTESADSANSANSAESYNISPMSGWSRRWGKPAPDFESALTSPCDDSFTPEDGLPMDTIASSHKPLGFSDAELDTIVANSFLSQQSADIPTIEILASDPLEDDDLDLCQPAEPLHTHSEPQSAVMDGTNVPKIPFSGTPEVSGCDLATTRSLVTLVRDALQVHMAESTAKLRRHLGSNPLAGEFYTESPATVVLTGLQTMAHLLEGRQADSPKDTICFCHVVYCLSLLAHEQDMASLHKTLFRQALTYGHWFSQDERSWYLEVVYSLWKPDDMSDADIAAVLIAPTGPMSGKGKEREGPSQGAQCDPLVFLAQYFLDELEHSALGDSMLLEILASDLTHHHIADGVGVTRYSSFGIAAVYMIQGQLLQRYSGVPGFVSSVKSITDGLVSGYVSAPRRLELELMQAGKMHLPPQTVYDDYVGHVRQQMDLVCAMQGVTLTPRQTYYAAGIKLMQQLMASENRLRSAWTWMDHGKDLETMTGEADLDLDALIHFGPTPPPSSPPTNDALAAPEPSSGSTVGGSRDSLAASAAPPRPSSSSSSPPPSSVRPNIAGTVRPHSPATTTIRVESDSCCDVCGYRPKGDPRWFAGSMAKHQKIKHGETRIYQCPYPGCSSQYTNRPDNLQQHQMKKNHFVHGQTSMSKRNRKREWVEDG